MSTRASAYLLLWALLFLVAFLRRDPEVPVHIEKAPPESRPWVIDLNRDPWERIALMTGIGETLARRIVAGREERGGFGSLAEVQALPGVPDGPLESARPWLALDGRPVAVSVEAVGTEARKRAPLPSGH